MSTSTIQVELRGDTAELILSRPERRNALSRVVHHDLGAALDVVAAIPEVRYVVLAGAEGIFSSGGDLDELSNGLPEGYVEDYWDRMNKTVLSIARLDKVVIAKIEGAAVGAGAALALSADIVLAESTARVSFPFVRIGFVPDAGSTWVLPRNVGYAVARDLLLTGRWIEMPEALGLGLVSRVVAPGELDACVEEVLDQLRQAPQSALVLTKGLINGHERSALERAVRAEGESQPVAERRRSTTNGVVPDGAAHLLT